MKPLTAFLKKPVLPYCLVVVAVFLSYVNAHNQLQDLMFSDLGPRVTSATALAHKQPAYFEIEANLPVDSLKNLNGCTITPFVILLNYSLPHFSTCSIKEIWLVGQFLLFVACGILTIAFTNNPGRRYLQCFSFIIFFVCSRYWAIHIYAGQIHILYAFLFFLLYALKARQKEFLFGVTLAFAIACRPLFFPSVFIVLIWYNKKALYGLLCAAAFLALLTVVTGTVPYWFEYLRAMRLSSLEMPAVTHPEIEFKRPETYFPPCTTAQSRGWIISDINKQMENIGRAGGLLKPLQTYLLEKNILITNTLIFSGIAFAASAIVTFFLKVKNKAIGADKFVFLLFVMYILSEICTPAPRGPYNYVLWLFGAFMIISRGNFSSIVLLLIGLSLNHDHPYIHHGREWGEGLMLLAGFLFLFGKRGAGEAANTTTVNSFRPTAG